MIAINPVFWVLVFCAAFCLWLIFGRLFHKIGKNINRIYEDTKRNLDLIEETDQEEAKTDNKEEQNE